MRSSSLETLASASSSSRSRGWPWAWIFGDGRRRYGSITATSHQIRVQADRLLGPEVSDADGNREERRHAVSVFNGPAPEIRVLSSQKEEVEQVGQWVSGRAKDGVAPHEFGVFVRSATELDRARWAVQLSGLPFKILDENVETSSGHVSISTMHPRQGVGVPRHRRDGL